MICISAIDKTTGEENILGYASSWMAAAEDLTADMEWFELDQPNENYRFKAEEI